MKIEFKEYNKENIKEDMGKRKKLNVEIMQGGNLYACKFLKTGESIILESDIDDNIDLSRPASYRKAIKNKEKI